MTCQAGAQDAARFEQRLVDRVPVGSQRSDQRGGGHAVERDGNEHCALFAAEILIDGPVQRTKKLVPFCALARLEAEGQPVPVFLIQGRSSRPASSGGRPSPKRQTPRTWMPRS